VRRPDGRFRQPPFLPDMLFGAALNIDKDPRRREEEVKDG
jgi:hypothetical protein